MKLLFALNTIILTLFVGLTIFLTVYLPSFITTSTESRQKLNHLNTLASQLQLAKEQLKLYEKDKPLLFNRLPSAQELTSVMAAVATKYGATATLVQSAQPPASGPFRATYSFTGVNSITIANIITDIQANQKLIAVKKVTFSGENANRTATQVEFEVGTYLP